MLPLESHQVALPPGKQCMIAGWFVLSLILQVMESPMTRVFNLSELMVRIFSVSDPVTGGGKTRKGSAFDSDLTFNLGEPVKSFCRLNEWYRLSIPTAFPSRSHEKIVLLQGLRGDLYYYLYLLVAQTLFHPILHLNHPWLTTMSEAGLAAQLSSP